MLADDAEHVVEADLEVVSGSVSLYGCTEQPVPEHKFDVPASRYRVRVSYLPANPPAHSDGIGPGTYFRYWLEMWLASGPAAVAVRKQGPTPWG